ncbi:MAG: ribonuclease R, partial [Acidobacteria bacterium]
MTTRDDLLKQIRDRVQHPASARELMQLLKVPREERASFRRQLKALAAEGELVEVRGHRYGVADKMDLVVGRLHANPGGFGFVVPDRRHEAGDPDIFVAAPNLQEAMHGDRVVARIERYRSGDRPEGRIVRILERANARLVGRFDLPEGGLGFVSPFDQRITADVAIPAGETRGAKPGEMVAVDITRWPTPSCCNLAPVT